MSPLLLIDASYLHFPAKAPHSNLGPALAPFPGSLSKNSATKLIIFWSFKNSAKERERGKILYFAHDEHVETGLGMLGAPGQPPPCQYQQIRSAGRYLRSALGSDLLVIGTYLGHGEGFGFTDKPSPAVHSMEDLLGSVSVPQVVMNLHELALTNITQGGDWLGFIHIERTTIKDAFGFATFNVSNARTQLAKADDPIRAQDTSWIPNASVARKRLSFVEQKNHPILPLR